MAKGMDRKKETKKKPGKTLEEKRAAKRVATACHMTWVCGKPCSSSSGGPDPPCLRRMETSPASSVSSLNPSNTAPS